MAHIIGIGTAPAPSPALGSVGPPLLIAEHGRDVVAADARSRNGEDLGSHP